jgi:hypothetical protein
MTLGRCIDKDGARVNPFGRFRRLTEVAAGRVSRADGAGRRRL